jgi:lipoprotein-releasing system ATP-binding protein
MVRAENITKSFGALRVLKGINITIEPQQIVSVVGASGAGKTTLLQIIGTLSKPDTGQVFIHQTNVSTLNDKQLSLFRNKEIGFIFQFHHLLSEFTALENICIPQYIANKSKHQAEKRAIELLNFLGLKNRAKHKPSELSGGEKQRVAVARALANNPSIVMADEPSGNLDSKNQEELHHLFFQLRDEFKQTFVIVTHNESLSQRSDTVIHIKDGVITT